MCCRFIPHAPPARFSEPPIILNFSLATVVLRWRPLDLSSTLSHLGLIVYCWDYQGPPFCSRSGLYHSLIFLVFALLSQRFSVVGALHLLYVQYFSFLCFGWFLWHSSCFFDCRFLTLAFLYPVFLFFFPSPNSNPTNIPLVWSDNSSISVFLSLLPHYSIVSTGSPSRWLPSGL